MERFTDSEKNFAQDFLLTAFPNPERRDCPDEDVLKVVAEGSSLNFLSEMSHVSSCSECYREYVNYKMDLNN